MIVQRSVTPSIGVKASWPYFDINPSIMLNEGRYWVTWYPHTNDYRKYYADLRRTNIDLKGNSFRMRDAGDQYDLPGYVSIPDELFVQCLLCN